MIASTVFWTTFFINQRGCPPKFRRPLFKQLVSKNPAFGSKEYEALFIKVHDSFEEKFIDQLELFCEDWMKTLVAEYWIQDIERKRYCSLISAFDFKSKKEKAEHLTRAHLSVVVVDDHRYPGYT